MYTDFLIMLSLSLSLPLVQAIYSIFKTESEQVDDLRMIINVSPQSLATCMHILILVWILVNITCIP